MLRYVIKLSVPRRTFLVFTAKHSNTEEAEQLIGTKRRFGSSLKKLSKNVLDGQVVIEAGIQ